MNYEERDKKIEERIKQKDLSINVSWAINNATEVATAFAGKDSDTEAVKQGIREWANWYLELYEEMRHQQAEKQVDSEDKEKPL